MAQVGFGPVYVGEERTVRIAMTGDGPFTAGEPVIMGPDAGPFVVYSDGCGDQSHPDGECFVEVRFAPWRTGAHSATLVLPVEGEPEPISIPLTGEGLPVTAISPAELDFGTVPYQSPPPAREVIVENTSDRTLGPLSILLPGPRLPSWFERVADSCSGTTIAPGATCRMSIGFTAARRGSAVSELIVTSEPGSRPVGEIPLRGATPPVPPRLRQPRPLPLPRPAPPATPDFSAGLEERLGAALTHLRGAGRRALLRRGLVVRGIAPPVRGRLGLVVRARTPTARRPNAAAGRRVAVRLGVLARAGRRVAVRAPLTRLGRRLLRTSRPVMLDVRLTLKAQRDGRLSEAKGTLRLVERLGEAKLATLALLP